MASTQSMSPDGAPPWAEEVLHFWFKELAVQQWFVKDPAVDARIRDRFLGLYDRLAAEGGAGVHGPRALLAAVLVLDQFPRNLFRGSARAFATDAIARRLSLAAIDNGFDKAMSAAERLFLYLPFEHAENIEDQARSVHLVSQLGNPEWTRYALAHQEVIEEFGRFPHRNALLGRASTAAETEMLKDPSRSF